MRPEARPAGRSYYFLRDADPLEVPNRAHGFDLPTVRRDFPALHQQVNGHPLAFLDNGATTQKPQAVIDGTTRFYAHENSNIQRAAHTLARRATDLYDAARAKVQRFLGAADPNEVVFVRGATEAINFVAEAWLRPRLGPGDEVVVSELEHHSNFLPWQRLCRQVGAELVIAPCDDRGDLDLGELGRRLGPRTRLVAVTHVSNVLGTVVPAAEVCAIAHARGVPVLLDGAQGAPHVPVNVQQLGCDFYAVSGHKMYGPTGIGVLYARQEHLEGLEPYQVGGGMVQSVGVGEEPLYAPQPHRFEAGTPNLAGAIGLGAAIDYLERIGFQQALDHEARVVEHFLGLLRRQPRVTVVGHPKERVSIVSFVVNGVPLEAVGRMLDDNGIEVRVGPLCAMPLMHRFGLEGTARVAVGLYNSIEEVERVAQVIGRL